MPVAPTPAVTRALARTKTNARGCWEWQGALLKGRYGVIQLGRGIGTDLVHRVVYEALVGPIPAGLDLDHLCENTRCCNPAHLQPATRPENVRRQWRAGRADPGRRNRQKTHCPHGHPYDRTNTYVHGGRRHCRTCSRLKARAKEAA